jgi:hypothetical protein
MIPSSYARVATGKPCCIAAASRNCRKKAPQLRAVDEVPAKVCPGYKYKDDMILF